MPCASVNGCLFNLGEREERNDEAAIESMRWWRRHLYLYRRSLPRMMEIFYWPFLDLVIWGFITVYLMKFQGQIQGAVTFFLGALILWDILFRAQQGITISFLEEIWARNLDELVCQSAQAERVPRRDDGDEYLQGVGGFYCHGRLRRPVLLLQHFRDRDVAGSVRLESGDDRMDYRGN